MMPTALPLVQFEPPVRAHKPPPTAEFSVAPPISFSVLILQTPVPFALELPVCETVPATQVVDLLILTLAANRSPPRHAGQPTPC